MSLRPLVFVSGLTLGDYLLWNWSLKGSHDVIALVSGLTLPPLALAFLWLLALSAGRLLAFTTRSSDVGRAPDRLHARRADVPRPHRRAPSRQAPGGPASQGKKRLIRQDRRLSTRPPRP